MRAHRELAPGKECRYYNRLLDAPIRRAARCCPDVQEHLAGCAYCRHAAEQLGHVDAALGVLLAEAVLGWGARRYLDTRPGRRPGPARTRTGSRRSGGRRRGGGRRRDPGRGGRAAGPVAFAAVSARRAPGAAWSSRTLLTGLGVPRPGCSRRSWRSARVAGRRRRRPARSPPRARRPAPADRPRPPPLTCPPPAGGPPAQRHRSLPGRPGHAPRPGRARSSPSAPPRPRSGGRTRPTDCCAARPPPACAWTRAPTPVWCSSASAPTPAPGGGRRALRPHSAGRVAAAVGPEPRAGRGRFPARCRPRDQGAGRGRGTAVERGVVVPGGPRSRRFHGAVSARSARVTVSGRACPDRARVRSNSARTQRMTWSTPASPSRPRP